MKASAKAFLGLFLVMFVVMSLFFMMSRLKFETTLTHLVQSRLTVLSESVADPLEAAMDLGLSLSELRNADALITRAKENDSRIDAVDVFDLSGEILFSTTPDRLGRPVKAEVLDAQLQTDMQAWELSGDTTFSSGMTLTNNIGQNVGGVLITYSKTEIFSKVADLGESLITNMLAIVALFSGLAYFVIKKVFGDLDQYMGQIDDAMEAFPELMVTESDTPVAGSDQAALDSNDMQIKLRAVASQFARANREIDSCGSSLPESGKQAD